MTLVYIENDRLDRMACLHQFCSKLEEKYYRNFWSIESSFWRAGNGRNTSFWKVSHDINMNGYSRNSAITLQVTECSGCPLARKTNENVDQARELFRENRRIAIHEVGNILGTSFGTFQRILKDNLSMHQIAAKFASCLLSEEQKEHHVSMCQICSARTNCKLALFCWYLMASVGKCATERSWKLEFWGTGFSTMRMHPVTVLCLCVCEFVSANNDLLHILPSLSI